MMTRTCTTALPIQRLQLALLAFAVALTSRASARGELFEVDRNDDPVAGGSSCTLTNTSDCSLRGAILLANAGGSVDTILLPGGSYALTIAGAHEELGYTGDLDLTQGTWLVGDGWIPTVVSAAGLNDRVMHVHAGASGSVIEGMTFVLGFAPGHIQFSRDGGGLLCDGGELELRDVRFTSNSSLVGAGGGLAIGPACEVFASELLLISNSAADGGGASVRGALVADRARVSGNVASGKGGGLYLFDGIAELTSSLVADNSADSGGGLRAEASSLFSPARVRLQDSTVARNTAGSGAGLYLSGLGDVELRHVTVAAQEGGDLLALLATGTLSLPTQILVKNSIFDASCEGTPPNAQVGSLGGSFEVDTDSCQLSHLTDQVQVSAADLALLPLGNYGGSTPTVALGANSIARGAGLADNCTSHDQRQAPRGPGACDSGAFEYVPGFLFADDFEAEDLWAWSAAVP